MENNPPPLTTTTTKPSVAQSSLRALNKSSHKISKTNVRSSAAPALPSKPEPADNEDHPAPAAGAPPPPPQPPVYNINKNDFRDVVQKLTGSPAHNAAPPARPAAPTASRLHKNRPPPLSALGPRPPETVPAAGASGPFIRPWSTTPLSPLPPLPAVSAAAESPITAYMRCLRGGSGVAVGPPATVSAGVPLFPLPTSPLGFGCLPSPQSAFQATMPSSPRVPVSSPKCKET